MEWVLVQFHGGFIVIQDRLHPEDLEAACDRMRIGKGSIYRISEQQALNLISEADSVRLGSSSPVGTYVKNSQSPEEQQQAAEEQAGAKENAETQQVAGESEQARQNDAQIDRILKENFNVRPTRDQVQAVLAKLPQEKIDVLRPLTTDGSLAKGICYKIAGKI